MHRTAEYGIAAHWKYKEASDSREIGGSSSEEEKLSWLRQILEWQQDMSDNKEFLSLLKSDLDLFSENVYCFTPAGDVKTSAKRFQHRLILPTVYTVPWEIRWSAPESTESWFRSSMRSRTVTVMEIITSQNSKGPSRDWLKIVKSTQAKNKINQWFKQERKEDNILKGKEMLAGYAKLKGRTLGELTKPKYMEAVMRKYGFRDWESVLAALGHGGLKEGQILNKLIEAYEKEHKKEITDEKVLEAAAEAKEKLPIVKKEKGGIVVKGIDDVAVRFAKCCSPIPGDEIVGFVTRGRGVTIHRTDCVNVMNLSEAERVRLIDAEWQGSNLTSGLYTAEINVYANNRTGLLVDISRIFTERKIDLTTINSRTSKQGRATISMTFDVHSTEELNSIVEKIRQVESVLDIERTTG